MRAPVLLSMFLLWLLPLTLRPATLELDMIEDRDRALWNQTVQDYLGEPLWVRTNIYEAAHCLMVPLHAAFYFGEESWQQGLSNMFHRFKNADPLTIETGQLRRLQWSYLCTRFLVLAHLAGKQDLIPSGFADGEEAVLAKEWGLTPGPTQGRLRQSTLWRLDWRAIHWNESPSFRALFGDNDFFAFACAAELRRFRVLAAMTNSPLLDDIVSLGHRVFEQEGRFQDDGGWVFEPGAFTDHPEYAYAGHTNKVPGMEPLKVPEIAGDTSHAHRFPLWLQSMANAFPLDSAQSRLFRGIHRSLERQFYSKVFLGPAPDFPAPRTRNFMDGWNGVYRWGYGTIGPNNGYGPYELSGTYTLGWWTFFSSERARATYKTLASVFPLPAHVRTLYKGPVDPNVSQIHPMVRWPEYFENGFGELVSRLAAKHPPLELPPLSRPGLRLRTSEGHVLAQIPLKPTEILTLDFSTDLQNWDTPTSVGGASGVIEAVLHRKGPAGFVRIRRAR